MNFTAVIECLKKGGHASRSVWHDNKEIVMQIPQCIAKDVVPKMTSLPAAIKPKISTVGSGEISYHDQVIMITFTDDGKTPASATYYIPSWEDILAEDWNCLTPAEEYVPDPRPVTERIKTFEDACDDLNRRAQAGDKLANDLMTDLQFNSPRTPDLLAYIQLRIITYALNEGWVPQFTEDEYRYYPYFYLYTQKEIDEMSEDDKAQLLLVVGRANNGALCGLSYAGSSLGFSASFAGIGARLAFKSSELAKYAGRQFAALWSALVFKPIPEEQK